MAGRRGSVEIMPVKTSGDRIQDRPLAEVGGKALWTKELDLALLAGETDCSVHSMKDVESERPETLAIAAMLPRADVRDRLIGADSIAELPQGARGRHQFAAPRRAAQAAAARPRDPFRSAAMSTPGLPSSKRATSTRPCWRRPGSTGWGEPMSASPIELNEMLPAPAQGAIGIECRSDDAMTAALLQSDRPCRDASGGAGRAGLHAVRWAAPAIRRSRPVPGSMAMRSTFACELLSEDGGEHLARTIRFAGRRS